MLNHSLGLILMLDDRRLSSIQYLKLKVKKHHSCV
jgi:hypothetical protein